LGKAAKFNATEGEVVIWGSMRETMEMRDEGNERDERDERERQER